MGDAIDPGLARQLVSQAHTATLSTLARRPLGHPFGSLVAVASDERGRPILLLSELAEHTKNLDASPLASLLFADHRAEDPLANPRVTILGTCRRIASADVESARVLYLARHPSAKAWVTFSDFCFFRMEPGEIRLVAGFGQMGWIDVDAYKSST